MVLKLQIEVGSMKLECLKTIIRQLVFAIRQSVNNTELSCKSTKTPNEIEGYENFGKSL